MSLIFSKEHGTGRSRNGCSRFDGWTRWSRQFDFNDISSISPLLSSPLLRAAILDTRYCYLDQVVRSFELLFIGRLFSSFHELVRVVALAEHGIVNKQDAGRQAQPARL